MGGCIETKKREDTMNKKFKEDFNNIVVSTLHRTLKDGELELVDSILVNEKLIMTRYLRGERRAMLAEAPARDDHGFVLPDAPPVHYWMVSPGVPLGAMVAFIHEKELYIGWAKRNQKVRMVENIAYKKIEMAAAVRLQGKELRNLLDEIVMSIEVEDIEDVLFSKRLGKSLAVLRALDEKIYIGEGRAMSSLAGPLPDTVAYNIRWFVSRAEKVFNKKAVNISPVKPVMDLQISVMQM
jgi:hypothetical protein